MQGPGDLAGIARAATVLPARLLWTVGTHLVGPAGAYSPLDRPRRQQVDVPGPPPPGPGAAGSGGRFTDELAVLLSQDELVCVQDRGWNGVWRSPTRDIRSITRRERHPPEWPGRKAVDVLVLHDVLVRIDAARGRVSFVLPPGPAGALVRLLGADA